MSEEKQRANRYKMKKSTLIVLLAIIILVSLGVLIRFFLLDPRTNEEQIMDATIKTFLSDAMEYSGELEVESIELEGIEEYPRVQAMLDILEDLNFQYTIENNYSSQEFTADFKIRVRAFTILEGKLYSNEDILALSIPKLYDVPFYTTWLEIEAEYGINKADLISKMIEIRKKLANEKYESIEEFSFLDYKAIYQDFYLNTLDEEVIKEDITIHDQIIPVKTYQYHYGEDEFKSLIKELMSQIEDDQMIQSKVQVFENQLGEARIMGYYFDEQAFEEVLETTEIDVDSTISIDKDERIRKTTSEMDLSIVSETGMIGDDLHLELKNEVNYLQFNEEVKIEEMNIQNGVNILSLNDEEFQQLLVEIQTRINEYYYNNGYF